MPVTRSAASRANGDTGSTRQDHDDPQQLSSPPKTPGPAPRKTANSGPLKQNARTKKVAMKNDVVGTPATPVTPPEVVKEVKSSRSKGTKSQRPMAESPMKGEVDKTATPAPASKKRKRARPMARSQSNEGEPPNDAEASSPKVSNRKRGKIQPKIEDSDELPHNMGKLFAGPQASAATQANLPDGTKPVSTQSPLNEISAEITSPNLAKASNDGESPKKKAKSAKDNNYGLKSGQTPYPDWPHPTHEECYEVSRLLSQLHGEIKAPKTIPMPSLTVSGCGEVPSVLDALIRTRLSAATSGGNSSRAFQGLVETFGILQEGIGKGSVDWDAVRRADVKEIFTAIKSGGLADVKSKDIKAILEMVYEENQARRVALLAAAKSNDSDQAPVGANNESIQEKNAEVARAEANVLSLDHVHLLSSDDAFKELIKYPGIGPKTASCVLLFCLQRPSFAVDTHVFRLCKWLGWVPPEKSDRNSCYAHCEIRIPDELKYPLHQLFIKHGKTCPRCRAITGEGSKDWDEGCVIDHLVKRTGARKTGQKPSNGTMARKSKGKGKGKGRGKKATVDDDSDEPEGEDDGARDDEDLEEGRGDGSSDELSDVEE